MGSILPPSPITRRGLNSHNKYNRGSRGFTKKRHLIQGRKTKNDWSKLPDKGLTSIAKHLDFYSLNSLLCVSKHWYKELHYNQSTQSYLLYIFYIYLV